jgi:hypothetical protein
VTADTNGRGASIRGHVASLFQTPAPVRRAWALALAAAALAAALPFLRGVLLGRILYFRDLAVLFYPYRQYVVEGLRAGQLRFWDPYVHEGVPLLYPPLAYPLDVLQAAWADRRAISSLLALHVPLAAAAFVLLARRFGLTPLAAAGGAIVYALGGFLLSTLNLYIYVEAAAWAPVVVLTLRAAGRGRPRAVAAAALATALAISTLGIELALQAVLVGLVVAFRPRRARASMGAAAAALLGAGLAAPAVLVMRATMSAGERAHGFATDVVLNQSIHPFTLLQVLIANLYGDLARLPDRWWGSNFFDRGFPYILSLYLGATVLALAAAGAGLDRRRSMRVLVLAMAALVVALGRYGGLEPVLDVLPGSWRVFRYPTKAFFTVHLCTAVLAAIGLRKLARGAGWRLFAAVSFALGVPLLLAPALPMVVPQGSDWFVAHFFPPAMDASVRAANFADLLRDAAAGGALAVAAAVVAAAVRSGRVASRMGAALIAAIVCGDLLRAGGGLNPMMDARALGTSPEIAATLQAQPGLQRVYSCRPEASPAYWEARRERPHDHEALTLSAWADTLTPHFNRTAHFASALGEDLTSLVPLSRLLPRSAGAGCEGLPALLPRLRTGGVSHVLSLDPLAFPGLQPVAEVRPPRLAPLHVFVYAVTDPVPLRFVAASVRAGDPPSRDLYGPARVWMDAPPHEVDGASGTVRSLREEPGRIDLEVDASRESALVIADGWSAGWRATVDGSPAPVRRVDHHRAVWIPAGRSTVTLSYRPPGLVAGLGLSALSLLVVAGLWRRGRVSARP